MRYKNASDILPDDLLKQVQKYAAGETLYFPKDAERQKWGANSGARDYYTQRNQEIRHQPPSPRIQPIPRIHPQNRLPQRLTPLPLIYSFP
ncbi:MAG: CD3324 family protein [Defluviitaleaceae bacterium]|nr:CD3324 family protein [Defluviitaleaceae bacterium]